MVLERLSSTWERITHRPRKTEYTNFVQSMREALSHPEPADQRRLLQFQLEAALKEYFEFPFHSHAFELKPDTSPTGALADLDLNPAVTSVVASQLPGWLFDNVHLKSSWEYCRQAVADALAKGDKVRARRYLLEQKQVEKTGEHLSQFFEVLLEEGQSPMVIVELLTHLAAEQKVKRLQAGGWQTTDFTFLPEAVKQQMNLHQAQGDVIVGQKVLYVMPQSSVHKGWKSMYVVVQPVYIPETDRWFVLHDQLMTEASWSMHHANLAQTAESYRSPNMFTSRRGHEHQVMNQIIPLANSWSTVSGVETLAAITQQDAENLIADQSAKQARFEQLAQTLPLHIDHLLRSMAMISERFPVESEDWARLMDLPLTESLSTLLQELGINSKQIKTWEAELKKTMDEYDPGQSKQIKKEHLLRVIPGTPWLQTPVLSQLECVVFSAPGLLKNGTDMDLFFKAELTQSDIVKLIGSERAKNWTKGVCRACHKINMVGECSICFKCEQKDNFSYLNQSNIIRNSEDSKTTSPRLKNKKIFTKEYVTITDVLQGDFGLVEVPVAV